MELILIALGLALGSFYNVLIDRLPNEESIWRGRSHCDFCKKTLRWYELIPIFSWLLQSGKCRRCHKSLSIQYPLLEIVTAISFFLIFQQAIYTPSGLAYLPALALATAGWIIYSCFFIIFVADLKYQIIPDSMVLIGTLAVLAHIFISMNYELSTVYFLLILPYLWSAIGASAFFFVLWFITKGRGMGFGDVKLAIFMGLFLGFPKIIIALYVAFLTGAAIGVILILVQRKSLKTKIAFGPFLIFGTAIAWFWGERIIEIWKSLM